MTAAIYDALDNLDFVHGSLGKTIAEIRGNRIQHSVNVYLGESPQVMAGNFILLTYNTPI